MPHGYHAGCTVLTLVAGTGCWCGCLSCRRRIASPASGSFSFFQIGIILTANYTFINYITIALTFLLLDDEHFEGLRLPHPYPSSRGERGDPTTVGWGRLSVSAFFLTWVFYANSALLIQMVLPDAPLPLAPAGLLEPFRFANRFGLFAVMTPARYEIEFQGTRDGKVWTPYPFRYKPQDPRDAPRIYAPYQPRFD